MQAKNWDGKNGGKWSGNSSSLESSWVFFGGGGGLLMMVLCEFILLWNQKYNVILSESFSSSYWNELITERKFVSYRSFPIGKNKRVYVFMYALSIILSRYTFTFPAYIRQKLSMDTLNANLLRVSEAKEVPINSHISVASTTFKQL